MRDIQNQTLISEQKGTIPSTPCKACSGKTTNGWIAAYQNACQNCKVRDVKASLTEEHVLKNPSWGNSKNPKEWETDEWKLAKLFMPHGYKDKNGPDEIDFNGMIHTITNSNTLRGRLNNPALADKVSSNTHL